MPPEVEPPGCSDLLRQHEAKIRCQSYIAAMNGLVTRGMRGLIAIITVWCIGCSSFEPILERLVSDDAAANASCMGDKSPPTSDRGDGIIALMSTPAPSTAIGCACMDCVAAEPVVLALLGQSHSTPETPLAPLPAFLGTPREPQVPPPRS